jgi:hypothetical protein
MTLRRLIIGPRKKKCQFIRITPHAIEITLPAFSDGLKLRAAIVYYFARRAMLAAANSDDYLLR